MSTCPSSEQRHALLAQELDGAEAEAVEAHVEVCEERMWPVGQKRLNDVGLFDMHGNAATCVQDAFVSYPRENPVVDKEGLEPVAMNYNRVLRGGSFTHPAMLIRAAERAFNRAVQRDSNVGLRVARTYD
jgi:formylglycine-generating enzyme required for sulfatase activity